MRAPEVLIEELNAEAQAIAGTSTMLVVLLEIGTFCVQAGGENALEQLHELMNQGGIPVGFIRTARAAKKIIAAARPLDEYAEDPRIATFLKELVLTDADEYMDKPIRKEKQSYVHVGSNSDGFAGGNDDKALMKWMRSQGEQAPLTMMFYVFHHEPHCARKAKRGPCDCNPEFELLDKKKPWDYPPPDFPGLTR